VQRCRYDPEMKRALQRYWPLFIGLSLPLLLILFVVLIQVVSRWNAPPVTTPVLYWPDAGYWLRPQVRWFVEDGRLELIYTENQVARASQTDRSLRLSLYRPASGESEFFDIELPDVLEDRTSVALDLPAELGEPVWDSSVESPDGYRFEVSYGGSRGLFAELFGGYRSRMGYHLVGHGIRHPLPEKGRYMADGAFIAWWVEDSERSE
jgi:hypothetical protein